MADRNLQITITGVDKGGKKVFGEVDKAAGATQSKIKQLSSSISNEMAFAASAVAVGVGFALKGAFDAAVESQKISRETERVISTTGASAWTTAGQIGDLAEEISGLTGADDELVQSVSNLLLTFTNVKNQVGEGNDVFNQATGYALDLAAVMGTDASSAAVMLGKALNDPLKGMTKLTKAGVTFDEQQRAQIKTLTESGDILGAQKIILAELGKEFGGAAAAAQTPLDQLKVKLGNLQEDIGAGLIPIVSKGADAVGFLVDAFNNLPDGVQTVVVAGAGVLGVIGGVTVAVSKISEVFAPVFSIVARGFAQVQESIYGFTATLTHSSKVAAIASTGLTTGLAGALGVAGLALAAFSIFQTMAANSSKENEERVKGFSEALGDTTGKVREKTAAFIQDELEGTTWAKVLEKGGNSAELLTKKITDQSDKMKSWSANILDSKTSLTSFTAGTQTAAAFGDEFAQELLALQAAQGLTDKQTYELAKTTAELNIAYGTAQTEVRTNAAVQDALAVSTGGLSVATKNAVADLKELSDELRAQTDPYFAAYKGQKDLKTAQDELNEATKRYGANSKEAQAATLKTAEAAIGYRGDLIDLKSTMVQGNGFAEFQGQLDGLKQYGFDPSSQAAKNLSYDILGVANTAGSVDGTEVNIGMDLDARKVKAKIDYLRSQTDPATGFVPLGAIEALSTFAKGGMVQNGPFLVGEQGPELGYKSGSTVRIFSNKDSSRMVEPMNAGNGKGDTINVYVNNSNASAYDIGREVLWSRKVAG